MAVKFRDQALDHAARRLDGDVIMFAPATARLSVVVAIGSLFAVGVAAANIKVPDSYSVDGVMVADRGIRPVVAEHSGNISAIHAAPGEFVHPGAMLASLDIARGTGPASKDTVSVAADAAGLMCCLSVHVGMRTEPGDLLFGIVPEGADVSLLVEVPEGLARTILATPSVTVRSSASSGLKSSLAGSVAQVSASTSQLAPDGKTTLRIKFDASAQPALRSDFAARDGDSVPVVLELSGRTLFDKVTSKRSRSTSETAAGNGA